MENIGYKSPIAIHPGVTLKEVLEKLNINQNVLALRTDLKEETISRIIHGEYSITMKTALKLERVLGISKDFWINFQKGYDEDLLRLKERKRLKNEVSYLDKFVCYKELAQRGFVRNINKRNIDNKIEMVEELLRFFGINSLSLVKNTFPSAFRKSNVKKVNKESLAAWLKIGEIKTKDMEIADYNVDRLRGNLEKMKLLTNQKPSYFSQKLVDLCKECGIILIYVPALKSVPVNGVTRWITSKNPVIQLSLRNSYADIFWFTFFHEIGHVLKHSKKECFINFESIEESSKVSKYEEEADNFSQKILIPNEKRYKDIFSNLNSMSTKIIRFAKEIKVDKGIIAGRLARETGDWAKFCRFRTKLKFN